MCKPALSEVSEYPSTVSSDHNLYHQHLFVFFIELIFKNANKTLNSKYEIAFYIWDVIWISLKCLVELSVLGSIFLYSCIYLQ